MPPLSAVALDAALPAQALTLADTLDGALDTLTGQRAGRKTLTAAEAKKRDALLALLHPIQVAAKRATTVDGATLREIYGVGKSLPRASLSDLVGAARAMLARLVPDQDGRTADALPGIAAGGAIKALADALKDYLGADTAQGKQRETASASLEDITSRIAQLAALRHAIQLAADQAFPPKTGRTTARKAFLLQPDKALGL